MSKGGYEPREQLLLHRAMTASLAVALLLLAVKFWAAWLTGSSAILADAAESLVHILAVGFAFFSLRLAHKPADEAHLYGHAKVSFFSAGFEGGMIILAALYIIFEATRKWIAGPELEHLGIGTVLTASTVVINGLLGTFLILLGRRRHSLIVEANGKHIFTDAWTSFGVLIGLGLVALTGWLFWDPLFAILVALNILWTGFGLIRQSVAGLMDAADPAVHRELEVLLNDESRALGFSWHHLRHRSLGTGHWVDVHLVFDDNMPLREAHARATAIERRIRTALRPFAVVNTHLEPRQEHAAIHRHPATD